MKKKLLTIAICGLLSACASVEKPDFIEENEVVQTDQEKDLFYNAFVGNIMEKEGKNNNAITYYENILKVQYDKVYFNKLIDLYLYKNDFISARSLVKNTKIEYLEQNDSRLAIIHSLANDNNDTFELFENEINAIKDKSDYPLFDVSGYYVTMTQLNNFFFQDDNVENKFLDFVKTNNLSQYNLLKNYDKEEKEKIVLTYNLEDFKGEEITIANVKNFINNKSNGDINNILKDKNLNNREKNELLKLEYKKLNESNNHNQVINLINQAENQGIEKDQATIHSQFFAYFSMFENNDALYSLDLIKDEMNKDFYFYYKSISNYRLGYKNAAKKYMVHVKDKTLISQDLSGYIDIMGVKHYLLSDLYNDEFEKNFYLFRYYMEKENQNQASYYLSVLSEVVNETGANDDYEFLMNDSNTLFNSVFHIDEYVQYSKNEYKKDSSMQNANSYLYSLLISNKFDETIASEVYESHKDDFKTNPSYLDTEAMYFLKIGNAKKALSIYKENNLIFIQSSDIQYNISLVYKALGDSLNEKKHMKYSRSIFHK